MILGVLIAFPNCHPSVSAPVLCEVPHQPCCRFISGLSILAVIPPSSGRAGRGVVMPTVVWGLGFWGLHLTALTKSVIFCVSDGASGWFLIPFWPICFNNRDSNLSN